MSEPKNISIEAYDYPLPAERIAKFPLPKRDESKLLVYSGGEIGERLFKDIPDIIPAGATLVFNNTKVIYARLVFHKETGARIEIFCLEPVAPADYSESFAQTESVVWKCMVGNLRKWKSGEISKKLHIGGEEITLTATLEESRGLDNQIRFAWDNSRFSFSEILEQAGELPIPPYLNRDTCESDKITYQTVYSKIKGSVAAPTAGLHFTPEVLDALRRKNISCRELTLHVGAGTFHPVKSDTIGGHTMHTEMISVPAALVSHLAENLGHIVAVGTTSVRTLESLYYIGKKIGENPDATPDQLAVEQWEPYQGDAPDDTRQALENIAAYLRRNRLSHLQTHTRIIIAPGFRYRIVSGIVTNFHQPKSTLLLLVSAFVGDDWQRIYAYALAHDFRFLSYGDSSLLLRN